LRRPPKGFTALELLVVIGIILLLVSIVVFGLRHVNATAARHETIAEMNLCSDMLKEYQNVNGMTNIEGNVNSVNSTTPVAPPAAGGQQLTFPIYQDQDPPISNPPPLSSTFIAPSDLAASGSGDFGDRGGQLEPRYIAPVIARTQAIMFVVLHDPKNRKTIAAVPANRILEGPPDTSGKSTLLPGDFTMLLDGWGNPIIYVPKGGMVVWMNPSSPGGFFLIRTSGTYQCDPTGKTGISGALPLVGASDRPFFASAGQDGFFTDPVATATSGTDYGSDNLYSHQQ